MEIKEIHKLFLKCKDLVIDTRKITNNTMFLAIKGENYDANIFTKEALEKGAAYVIIDNGDYYIDERTIVVKNSLLTLQELSSYHRVYLGLPIIALTGSNGKTTTKELIQKVLSKKYNTKATIGNLNNHIGVPLTLLSFTEETEIGIVEMGANHQKEIELLCTIAKPDYGYITNFGKAHLEGFGGIEGVIKGKSEMYDYLKLYEKKVFVNLDDETQNERTKTLNRITFSSITNNANLYIESIVANPFVKLSYGHCSVISNLIGLYNSNNISASIVIGKYFEVSDVAIKKAIAEYVPENNRSQLLFKNTNEIILDAYNANPTSMLAAIDNFIKLDKMKKIVILGDMFELGEESSKEHKQIIDYLTKEENIQCNFIGVDFYKNKNELKHHSFFEDFESFSDYLRTNIYTKCTILIKGSRGMALERTLNYM